MFPEIEEYYGESIKTDLYINVESPSAEFLTLNQYTGIEIGKNQPVKAQLIIKCANDTLPQEVAVQFDFHITAVVNASIDPTWKLYMRIPTFTLTNVVLSHDHVGMINRRYDNLLNSVAHSFINNVNAQWSRPFDITSLDNQTLPFVANMITKLHVSPLYQNEFLYVGFSYFVEQAAPAVATQSLVQQKIFREKANVEREQAEAVCKLYDKVVAYFRQVEALEIE